MITYLLIKNFALIEKGEVRFGPGLNIITGESGAGKSILVNALSQLCGERSRLDWVAKDASKAVIEAHISLSHKNELKRHIGDRFEDNGDLLIIRKEIYASGNSRIFINDSPATLSDLNGVSALLIDLHGQHQHQALLHPENHLRYLDAFADLHDRVASFARLWADYKKLLQRYDELQQNQAKALQMKDLYRFQIEELDKADLRENELEQLKGESKILNNYEKLHQAAAAVAELLYNADENAMQMVSRAEEQLKEMARFDAQFEELLSNLSAARQTIEEVGREAEHYLGKMEFDPQRAEFLRQRIAQLEFLLKKYQCSDMPALLDLREELTRRLQEIDSYDERLEELQKEKKQLEKQVLENGRELHKRRCEAAAEFSEKLDEIIHEIGMAEARFKVHFSFQPEDDSPFSINGQKVRATDHGFDRVQFAFSANPGESEKPINKIASGGELSRLMLALKTILAEKDAIPVLVFDEIDSGISGKTAQIVGQKINALAHFHQLICVTHLPQIAAFADQHYKVSKTAHENATTVEISPLKSQDKVAEVAHLLGGIDLSQQALDNAAQLLKEAALSKKPVS